MPASSQLHGFPDLEGLDRRGAVRIVFPCGGRHQHGTAWLVKTDKRDGHMLLSARHVSVCDASERQNRDGVIVWPSELEGLHGQVVAHSERYDVILLDVLAWFGNDQWLRKWDLAAADARVGEDVRLVTTRIEPDREPDRDDTYSYIQFVSDGIVAWVDNDRLYTNASGVGGESGGVVFNAAMEAVGLLSGTYPREVVRDREQYDSGNTTISVPASAIRQFLIEEGYLNP